MVSFLNDTDVQYFGGERTRLASAMIEGAMAVFFSENHIVFDLGLPSEERRELPDRETAALIARAGGAAFLLDVRMGAPEGDEGPPEYLAYDFVDLVEDSVIVSGVVRRSEVRGDIKDPYTVCLKLGEKVASTAVATIGRIE